MRVLLQIEYNGKNYCGWQIQKNGNSIQQTIQDCLQKILNQPIVLYSSGRTDSGVHAKNQYAHFDCKEGFDIKKLPYALQGSLPNDISVKNTWVVDDDFHARYSALYKTYTYQLYVSPVNLPLFNDFFVNLKKMPDIKLMKKAAKYLVGSHDFTSFCIPRKLDVEDNIRTIKWIKIKKQKNFLFINVCGTGFLHNMVRIIVGTLIDVGIKKVKPEDVEQIINAKDRTKAGKTFPAKGLVLCDVEYNRKFK